MGYSKNEGLKTASGLETLAVASSPTSSLAAPTDDHAIGNRGGSSSSSNNNNNSRTEDACSVFDFSAFDPVDQDDKSIIQQQRGRYSYHSDSSSSMMYLDDSFDSIALHDDDVTAKSVLHDEPQGIKKVRQRGVRFDHVEIREYAVTVGDHPWCRDSCPLTMDWEHTTVRVRPLPCSADYHSKKKLRRLSLKQRRERVALVQGFHQEDHPMTNDGVDKGIAETDLSRVRQLEIGMDRQRLINELTAALEFIFGSNDDMKEDSEISCAEGDCDASSEADGPLTSPTSAPCRCMLYSDNVEDVDKFDQDNDNDSNEKNDENEQDQNFDEYNHYDSTCPAISPSSAPSRCA